MWVSGNLHMGVSINGGIHNLHPKIIILSRENQWLLGTTILGNPHIKYNILEHQAIYFKVASPSCISSIMVVGYEQIFVWSPFLNICLYLEPRDPPGLRETHESWPNEEVFDDFKIEKDGAIVDVILKRLIFTIIYKTEKLIIVHLTSNFVLKSGRFP